MFRVLFSLLLMVAVTGCEPDVGFEPDPDNPPGSETGLGQPEPELPPLQGPIVRFISVQADMIEGGGNGEASFEVIPGDSDIESVVCQVDGVPVDCNWQGDRLVVVNPALGRHVIRVVAVDENGLRDDSSTSFSVYDRFKRQVQYVLVAAAEKLLSDILFVIDNSGSMRQEQENMADRIISFMERVDGLDWRIAIATTDPDSGESYGDGKIVPFGNGDYYLTSQMDIDDAKSLFADAVTREERGGAMERGIRSVYRSIERSIAGGSNINQQLKSFFRPAAALSVVLVSDEDESIRDGNGPLPEVEKSSGDNLRTLVTDTWGKDKIFQFNSIITRPGDVQCLQPNGTGFAYGKRYEQLSRDTGGVVGDICANDYGSQLTTIGQNVADLQKIFSLDCVPQDIDRDGRPNFSVIPLSGGNSPNFRLDGRKVIFDQALDAGDFNFVYFCLNSVSP